MTEKPKNPCGVSQMREAIDWRCRLDAIAGERQSTDTRESMLARAARKADVSFRNAYSLYYRQTKDPRFSVGKKIEDAAHKQADRFAAIADSLEAKDHDFYRAEIDRYRALAFRVRGPAG